MQRQCMVQSAGLTILILVGLMLVGMTGCGGWPVMREEDGRRPHAMGKSDQVFWPGAPHPVHLNEEFGLAYRQALENQIMNPAAAKNSDPIPGAADSRALQHSLTRYQMMFQSPPYSEFKLQGGSGGGGSTGSSSSGLGIGGTTK
jgi:hypothetical protein